MKYKEANFIYKDNISKFKSNMINEYGYNFNNYITNNIYNRKYLFINKEYLKDQE